MPIKTVKKYLLGVNEEENALRIARVDYKTKNLVKRAKPGDIAVIDHIDLDRLSAEGLIEAKISAVLNAADTLTGKYPAIGATLLRKAGIPIIDKLGPEIMISIQERQAIEIRENAIYDFNGALIAEGRLLGTDEIDGLIEGAHQRLVWELEEFAINTLEHLRNEHAEFLHRMEIPESPISLEKKNCLVVVRGYDYKEDLKAILPYIRDVKPIVLAVDGGADACLENGIRPDFIIGDMDSVSDKALSMAKNLIVHAYPDGKAPGKERLQDLGLSFQVFKAPGTSEDIAMIYAYGNGAELIVAVGTHSNLLEFFDKGRKGMSSTLLTRMMVGSRLVDARGVSKLYRSTIKAGYLFLLLTAGLAALSFTVVLSPSVKELLLLTVVRLGMVVGW